MKVNKFDVLSLSRIGKAVRLLTFVAVLCVFGSSDATAQYMQRDLAVQTLQQEILVLGNQSSTLQPGSALYNYTVSLTKYYKLMIEDLTSNAAEVKAAIVTNISGFAAAGKPSFSAVRPANPNTPLTEQQIVNMQLAAENILSI